MPRFPQYGEGDAAVRSAQDRARESAEAEAAYRAGIPQTLVMQDSPTPRTTRVLKRGQYDQPGEEVAAGVQQAERPAVVRE